MVELSLSFNSEPEEFEFSITDNAARRIKQLLEMEQKSGHGLKIKVIPGGCAGFMYEYGWAEIGATSDQKIIEQDGAKVIFGPSDLRHVNGSTLDFVESLAGSKFEISNPNASSTCGCGKSFA